MSTIPHEQRFDEIPWAPVMLARSKFEQVNACCGYDGRMDEVDKARLREGIAMLNAYIAAQAKAQPEVVR